MQHCRDHELTVRNDDARSKWSCILKSAERKIVNIEFYTLHK